MTDTADCKNNLWWKPQKFSQVVISWAFSFRYTKLPNSRGRSSLTIYDHYNYKHNSPILSSKVRCPREIMGAYTTRTVMIDLVMYDNYDSFHKGLLIVPIQYRTLRHVSHDTSSRFHGIGLILKRCFRILGYLGCNNTVAHSELVKN